MSKTTTQMLRALIASQHPSWDAAYVDRCACEQLARLDTRLDELLYIHCTTGNTPNFTHTHNSESFSILEIRAIRGNCSYLDAITLMDEYIRDPAAGRMRILRRR